MEYDSAFKKKEILTHGKCREGEWESTYLRDLEQTRSQGNGFSRLKREEPEVTMSGGPGDKSWGHMVAQQCVCTHYLNPLNWSEPTKKINLIWYVFVFKMNNLSSCIYAPAFSREASRVLCQDSQGQVHSSRAGPRQVSQPFSAGNPAEA